MRWTERQRRLLGAMGVRLLVERPADAGVDVASPPTPPLPAPAAATAASARAAPSAPLPAVVGDARAARIATLDWAALRDAVAGCTACALCQSRTQTVFGVGHEQARLMIVGEAPGEQEDRQGEPFVGQAGKLLDNMLRAIGLTRDVAAAPAQRAFIANTLKCRPPHNRNPDPAETAACAPFLARQIELVRPRLLLAMGRFAAQSLLATDEPIGRLRGRVHRWRDGTPVVVTYHPAYLLRTLHDKARAWDDLCLAASILEGAG